LNSLFAARSIHRGCRTSQGTSLPRAFVTFAVGAFANRRRRSAPSRRRAENRRDDFAATTRRRERRSAHWQIGAQRGCAPETCTMARGPPPRPAAPPVPGSRIPRESLSRAPPGKTSSSKATARGKPARFLDIERLKSRRSLSSPSPNVRFDTWFAGGQETVAPERVRRVDSASDASALTALGGQTTPKGSKQANVSCLPRAAVRCCA